MVMWTTVAAVLLNLQGLRGTLGPRGAKGYTVSKHLQDHHSKIIVGVVNFNDVSSHLNTPLGASRQERVDRINWI